MSKSSIIPTVGRIVWYWPADAEAEEDGMEIADPQQPFRADVVYVHSNGFINLRVIDHAGNDFDLHGIALYDAGYVADRSLEDTGYATWMPYQQAKAAKDSAS